MIQCEFQLCKTWIYKKALGAIQQKDGHFEFSVFFFYFAHLQFLYFDHIHFILVHCKCSDLYNAKLKRLRFCWMLCLWWNETESCFNLSVHGSIWPRFNMFDKSSSLRKSTCQYAVTVLPLTDHRKCHRKNTTQHVYFLSWRNLLSNIQ